MRVLVAAVLAFGLGSWSWADDLDDIDPDMLTDTMNFVCDPREEGGRRFDPAALAPFITGEWREEAAGMMPGMGVQRGTIVITYDELRGRFYYGDGQGRVELRPNFGAVRPLRWDPTREAEIPREHRLTDLSVEETLLVWGCDLTTAPQFTWEVTQGGQSAGGVISFASEGFALGVKWNSAMGAREQMLTR